MTAGGSDRPERGWRGVVEGYYGPPLPHAQRVDFVRWLGASGGNAYVYAPKDDPWQRARWTETYPAARLAELAELVSVGQEVGVAVVLSVSPGAGWTAAAQPALVDKLTAKLASLRVVGARGLFVAFDDVDAELDAALGGAHGAAVAGAVAALPDDVAWLTCPAVYCGTAASAYVGAFAAALPADVDITWTGPSVVSPTVTGVDVAAFVAVAGRAPVLFDNFPVNDGAMGGVLHLGPYPPRDPAIVTATQGVLCNIMALPLASRVGVGAALAWWGDPGADREVAWRAVVAAMPGLGALATASRSWLTSPAPDAALAAWAQGALDGDGLAVLALRDYFVAGCRADLSAELTRELGLWLAAWERSRDVVLRALDALDVGNVAPQQRAAAAFALSGALQARAAQPQQLFGIRRAHYPVARREGEVLVASADGLVEGHDMVESLGRGVLARLLG